MANEKVKHKSPIGEFLWNLPILSKLRGIPEFKTIWRGIRIFAIAMGLGLLEIEFGGLLPAEMIPLVAPMLEKELRERVSALDF